MDETEIGMVLGELKQGQEQQRELSQEILARLDTIPTMCAASRQTCRGQIDERLQQEVDTRGRSVSALFAQLAAHSAHMKPLTVGAAWALAWRLGAGLAATGAGVLVIRQVVIAATGGGHP